MCRQKIKGSHSTYEIERLKNGDFEVSIFNEDEDLMFGDICKTYKEAKQYIDDFQDEKQFVKGHDFY